MEFGIVITHEDGSIERFLEKPTWGQVFSDTINTGIYVLEPEVFDFIPKGEVVDFSGDVFPAILKRGKPLFGYVADGYWEDVGTLEAYLRAHQDILEGKVNIEIDGFRLARTSGSARARRWTRTPGSTVPRSSAPTASSRPARTCASTRCSAATS